MLFLGEPLEAQPCISFALAGVAKAKAVKSALSSAARKNFCKYIPH
jgi:hypothetical protein